MSGNATAGLCRLTVVAPSGSADLAVPTDVAIVDLLPTLLSHASGELADRGLEHDGWVLQRLGGPPLDEDRTPLALGLRDGETLHLRPRSAELPTLDFDDLIDGVSTAMGGRADRWREALTRRMFLGLTALTLALGLVMLLFGGPAAPRASAAATVALALLLGASALSRAVGDATAGAVVGLSAVAYAGVAGLLAPAALAAGRLLGAPSVLAATATATATALLAIAAVGVARPLFLAIAVAGGTGVAGGLLATLTALPVPRTAAVVVAVALALVPVIPMTAFRLAKLQLPALPTDAEDLQKDVDPVPGDLVVGRAAVADRYMSALFAAVGASAAVCLTLLAKAGGTAPDLLVGLVCATMLLRSRVLVSGWQRLALLVPAIWGGALLVLLAAARGQAEARSGVLLVVLVVLAGGCLAGARLLPGRRLVPYWGRIADIAETLLGASILPVVLAVLDVYHFARSLGG